MSYRTWINGVQIFGSNEVYPEWLAFLETHGIVPDGENRYDGEITDFMGMLERIEAIALGIEADRDREKASLAAHAGGKLPERLSRRFVSIYDLSWIKSDLAAGDNGPVREGLFDMLKEQVETGYLFMPLMAYEACRDDLEPCGPPPDAEPPRRPQYYALKEGRTVRLRAR